jgi:histidinol-phosphatase
MSSVDHAPRLELARLAAREAGQLTLRYFRSDTLAVELKQDQSPVTIADRQAEQLLRERIAERFPHDAILGEEFPEQPGTSGYRWILDPIDGTKSFIRGVPLYGTLVGVEHESRSTIGVIYIPALEECLYAATGGGAWYERGHAAPERAQVSKRTSLAEALVCSSDTRFPAARREAYDRLQQAAGVSRTWGDCYGYLLVATGRAEVMVDPIMNVWDAAAIQPILMEAGGTFTDWQGRPTIYSGDGIATNGHVLAEVLAFTRGV